MAPGLLLYGFKIADGAAQLQPAHMVVHIVEGGRVGRGLEEAVDGGLGLLLGVVLTGCGAGGGHQSFQHGLALLRRGGSHFGLAQGGNGAGRIGVHRRRRQAGRVGGRRGFCGDTLRGQFAQGLRRGALL